jgi:hypothetical protein
MAIGAAVLVEAANEPDLARSLADEHPVRKKGLQIEPNRALNFVDDSDVMNGVSHLFAPQTIDCRTAL